MNQPFSEIKYVFCIFHDKIISKMFFVYYLFVLESLHLLTASISLFFLVFDLV